MTPYGWRQCRMGPGCDVGAARPGAAMPGIMPGWMAQWMASVRSPGAIDQPLTLDETSNVTRDGDLPWAPFSSVS